MTIRLIFLIFLKDQFLPHQKLFKIQSKLSYVYFEKYFVKSESNSKCCGMLEKITSALIKGLLAM